MKRYGGGGWVGGGGGGGGGGGTVMRDATEGRRLLNKCLYGEAPPRLVQPLTLLYNIIHEKGTPFVYLLLTNGTPFTYLV